MKTLKLCSPYFRAIKRNYKKEIISKRKYINEIYNMKIKNKCKTNLKIIWKRNNWEIYNTAKEDKGIL